MRRLVGISSKSKKTVLALVAVVITFTSIHMAAAARTASLRRQQEQLEQTVISAPRSAVSQNFSNAVQAGSQNQRNGTGAGPNSSANPQLVAAAKPANAAGRHKRQIIISIADRKLALLEDGQVLKTYPIAVGASRTPSPEGDFVIVNHARDPVYRHRDKEIPPGKDNPLGTRWMGLSLRGYGIHGTNVQTSIGKAASHGCFRMRKQDVEELYTLVQVGDAVTVRRERDAIIAQVFDAPANAPAMTGSPTSPLLARWGGMTGSPTSPLLARWHGTPAKSEANAETQVAAAVTAVETTGQQ
jgi:lipoprotein-anchoring transpeptidase ErfK/SrfK